MKAEKIEFETLHLPEESDPEWVKLWDDCKNKKETNTKQLKFDFIDF